MKKIFPLLLILSFHASAEVTLEHCFEDATTYGKHDRAVAPLPECASLIDAEEEKVELISGNFRFFGKGNMIYVDKRDPNGIVLERSLIAGDQTDLSVVSKFFVDLPTQKLYVIQKRATTSELLIFNLGFLGNVTSLNLMRSTSLFSTATQVKPSEVEGRIEVTNAQGIFLINQDAESRTSRSQQKSIVSILKQ